VAPSAANAERSGIVSRLGLGIGSSALSQSINALQAIALVPLFLAAWGNNLYGQWLALSSLTSYLSLLDFGGQTFVGNLLAMSAARGDWSEFRRTLSRAVSLFLFLSTAALVLLVGGVLLARRFVIPGMPRQLSTWEAWTIVLQGVAVVLLAIPGGIYGTVYRAVGLFSRGTMAGNAFRTLGLGLSALLLVFRASPIAFAACSVLVGLALTVFIVWDTRRAIPECRDIQVAPVEARGGLLQFARGALHFWLLSLAQLLNQQGVILIIVRVLGSASVPLYATHKVLSNIPGYIAALVQGPSTPELSRLWAIDRKDRLSSLALGLVRALIVLTGTGALLIWLCAPSLYPLWTGKLLTVDRELLAILLIQAVIAAGWSSASWCLLAVNRPRSVAWWSVSNGLLTLILAGWLAGKHGLAGVALASLIGDLCCGLFAFPLLLAKLLSIRALRVFRMMLFAAAPLLLLFVVIELLRQTLTGLPGLLAIAGVVGLSSYPLLSLALGRANTRELLQFLNLSWSRAPGHKA
jgi:O-antigen/teichoic acid export membrane protein